MSGDSELAAFTYGEWVEFKLNTNVFGIVVGSDVLGLRYDVQLSPSGVIAQFYGETLRSLGFDDEDEVPPLEVSATDNVKTGEVIDFTKARELRATTKTEGAA